MYFTCFFDRILYTFSMKIKFPRLCKTETFMPWRKNCWCEDLSVYLIFKQPTSQRWPAPCITPVEPDPDFPCTTEGSNTTTKTTTIRRPSLVVQDRSNVVHHCTVCNGEQSSTVAVPTFSLCCTILHFAVDNNIAHASSSSNFHTPWLLWASSRTILNWKQALSNYSIVS